MDLAKMTLCDNGSVRLRLKVAFNLIGRVGRLAVKLLLTEGTQDRINTRQF